MNESVERLADPWPELREPVLVAGFEGWNDAGQSATAAVRWLARHLDSTRVARIQPDHFHVFTEMESRPVVRYRGGERVLRWPRHDLFAIRGASTWPHDLVAFVAHEPNLRWRAYCDTVLDLAEELGVRSVVCLGAFLAAVPHTRPVPITGYAWDGEVGASLRAAGTVATSYEGPTGIVTVLANAAHQRGLKAAALWAAVPHYLPTTANPKGALALLRGVRDLVDVPFNLGRLEDASAFFEAQVSEAVHSKGEVAEHVRELENSTQSEADLPAQSGGPDLPNAADVIKAFEDMLRQDRGPDEGRA